ncbi:MAG: GAF domain-containing protein [Anaerolineae bacterium]|nr:GAF domain-containing protein [Anaerolineae bacterium]
MWDQIKRLLSPPVFAGDEDKTRTAVLLNTILWTLIATASLALLFFLFLPGGALYLPLVGAFALGYAVSMWLMRRGRVSAASLLLLASIWISMAGVCLFFGGTETPAYFGFMIVVVAAGLLVGGRAAIAFAGLSVVAGLGIAWAQSVNMLPAQIGTTLPVIQWGALSFFVAIVAGLINLASRSLNEALQRARRTAAELEEERAGLEATVQERTRDLARRTRYLEATAAIAHEATSELELDGLMRSVAISISRQFGFYHTGIFLLDDTGEWAELKAASSEGGQRMLARGYRLRVGQEGLVGHVAGYGEPRIALDTAATATVAAGAGEDAVFFDNPDLPQTRSEAALPLRARGRVLGVLDVQSTEPEAFTPEDLTVLQTLADQVATAINNTYLFRQVEESAEVERRAFGELIGEKWTDLLRAQAGLGFASNRQALLPAGETWTPHMKRALESGQVERGQDTAPTVGAAVAIPIKVRGRVIGVIDGQKADGSGQWTEEELALMQTLAEQSAVALESARLYQDSQRRAVQERLVGDVTARMRESLDTDTVLRTAIREIGEALDLVEVEVWMGARGGPGGAEGTQVGAPTVGGPEGGRG